MSKSILFSLLVVTVLIPLSASAQQTVVRSVETAAREFRVQLYDAQRLRRDIYNRRVQTGDILLAQWNAADKPIAMREAVVSWFDEAALASQGVTPGFLPPLPELTEAVTESLDTIPAESVPVVVQEESESSASEEFPVSDDSANYFPAEDVFDSDGSWDDDPFEEENFTSSPFEEEAKDHPFGNSSTAGEADNVSPVADDEPDAGPPLPELPRLEVEESESADTSAPLDPPDFLAPPTPLDVEPKPTEPSSAKPKGVKPKLLEWLNREMQRAVKIGPSAPAVEETSVEAPAPDDDELADSPTP